MMLLVMSEPEDRLQEHWKTLFWFCLKKQQEPQRDDLQCRESGTIRAKSRRSSGNATVVPG
jgi:hypothetical protein